MNSTSDLLVVTLVVAASVVATVIDLRTRRVPNVLTASLAVVGIALAASGFGRIGLGASLVGGLCGVLLMLPGHLFGGTGAGDVKLLGAAGTLLGPADTWTAFLFTAIAGGILALGIAASRGRLADTFATTWRVVSTAGTNADVVKSARRENRFAYAPAIAVGMTLAAIGW